MQITATLVAAIVVTVIGLGILWANPVRAINRAVFGCSLHVVVWLLISHVMTLKSAGGLFWLRLACSVGAVLPLHLWGVKEVIANASLAWLRKWLRWAPWAFVGVGLAILPFTEWFIPSFSTTEQHLRGPGYHVYTISLILAYVLLLVDTAKSTRNLEGIRRIELQVWLSGGAATAATVILLMAANAVFHEPALIRLQPFVILTFFGGTVVSITIHRVFDGRQLLLVFVEKCCLVGAVACFAFVLQATLRIVVPQPIAFLATTALGLWFAKILNSWLDHWFHFYAEATTARQAAFAVTRRETRIEGLEKAFLNILKGWGHTEHALLVVGGRGLLRGPGIELPEEADVVKALRHLRWATPERLARERPTPERRALAQFLTEQRLGALVIGEGPTLTALVGVGVAASRRPFTYPQITQLLELASIIESALERAHFSVKAQHAEQLATVGLLGASLAHEIRNPLVTIKTFVQLLPKHHEDPAFREKFFTLIGDEVARIDRLTEQLLDLASPKAYQAKEIELHPMLRSSLELVAAKATDKRIQFLTDFQAAPDKVVTDASAAKQVLLNLCFNAIQAVETQNSERWVKVSTRNVSAGVEMIVEDSGPGIAPEIRPRLFQPFQTTKSSGFGLGLAICSDILAGLDATISVDPTEPGRGAVFRIVFPCPAS